MAGFTKQTTGNLLIWVGDPDCQAAHDAILAWLVNHISSFLVSSAAVNNICKGNLGESIAFCVGHWYKFSRFYPFPANAFNPLSLISKPDIDIVWIFFGEDEDDDLAILHEVKTTGGASMTIAYDLIDDYEKLFGTNPRLTLRTRLDSIKNEVEYKLRRPDLCRRISRLGGQSPITSTNICLLPTLVYSREKGDPTAKMLSVRSILCTKGWSSGSVETWAIGLSELDNRLLRLALGQR
jgi:hypothetical protein